MWAGRDDVHFYDIRHSVAPRGLSLGESLPMIARHLRHNKVRTTARYAHLPRDSVKPAAEPDRMAKPPGESHSPFSGLVQGRGEEVARGNGIGHAGRMLPDCLLRPRSGALVLRDDMTVAHFSQGSANTSRFSRNSILPKILSRVKR